MQNLESLSLEKTMNNVLVRPIYENLKLDDIVLPPHTRPQYNDDTRVDEKEKEMLVVDVVDEYTEGLSAKEMCVSFIILFIILLLFVPKIYLTSTIYYLSKEITSFQAQHDMLLEENKHLKHDVEDLRYEFLILNKR